MHIVAGLEPGGGMAESVPALCRHLRMLGHEVTLVTLDGVMGEAARLAEECGVRIVRYRRARPHSFFFSWRMWRSLGREFAGADVVHVHGGWTFPVWWGCWCALRGGKTLVRSPRATFDPVRLQHSAWKKRLALPIERWLLRRAHLVHVTSEGEAVAVKQQLGYYAQGTGHNGSVKGGEAAAGRQRRAEDGGEALPGDAAEAKLRLAIPVARQGGVGSVVVIPNGVELLRSSSSELSGEGEGELSQRHREHRGELSGEGEGEVLRGGRERRVVYLGRNHPLKGLDLLEAAWERVRRPGWRLTLYGEGLPGGLVQGAEKERVLREADLLVLPSRSENFGMVVAEALAAGVPVITTKGAPWEVLRGYYAQGTGHNGSVKGGDGDGGGEAPPSDAAGQARSGWWVDVGVEPLAEALREAMALTDEERAEMGANGRRLVAERFRWEAVGAQMAAAYRIITPTGLGVMGE